MRRGKTCRRAANFFMDMMEDQNGAEGAIGWMTMLMSEGVTGAGFRVCGLHPDARPRSHCADLPVAPNMCFGQAAMLALAGAAKEATTLRAAAWIGTGDYIGGPHSRRPKGNALHMDAPRLHRAGATTADGGSACAKAPRRGSTRATDAPPLEGWPPMLTLRTTGVGPLHRHAARRDMMPLLNGTRGTRSYTICLGKERGERRREELRVKVPMVLGAEFVGRRR